MHTTIATVAIFLATVTPTLPDFLNRSLAEREKVHAELRAETDRVAGRIRRREAGLQDFARVEAIRERLALIERHVESAAASQGVAVSALPAGAVPTPNEMRDMGVARASGDVAGAFRPAEVFVRDAIRARLRSAVRGTEFPSPFGTRPPHCPACLGERLQ